MNKVTVCALALLLSATLSFADDKKSGISISFSSDDSHAQVGPRHNVRDARTAITTRDGAASMLLMKDVVAVQLTDRALAQVSSKDDAGLIEGMLVAGVQWGLRKAVDVPIANIRSAEVRDGTLVLTNDKNQPVFKNVKVNGTDVLRDFTPADAARFVSALRAAKNGR